MALPFFETSPNYTHMLFACIYSWKAPVRLCGRGELFDRLFKCGIFLLVGVGYPYVRRINFRIVSEMGVDQP